MKSMVGPKPCESWAVGALGSHSGLPWERGNTPLPPLPPGPVQSEAPEEGLEGGGQFRGAAQPQEPPAAMVQQCMALLAEPRARRCARWGLIPGFATHRRGPLASNSGSLLFAFPIESGIEKINLLMYVNYLQMPGSEQASNECHFPPI